MTDTMEAPAPATPPSTLSLSVDSLRLLKKDIDKQTEDIKAATGKDDRGAATTDIVERVNEDGNDSSVRLLAVVDGMRTGLADATRYSDDEVATFGYLIEAVLKEAAVKDRIDKAVNKAIEARRSTDGAVDIDKLKADQKENIENFKSIKRLLTNLGQLTDAEKAELNLIEEPKARRAGGTGTSKPATGKNNEGYRYYVDGKKQPKSQNKFSSVAFYSTEKMEMTGEDASTLVSVDDSKKKLNTEQFKAWLTAQLAAAGLDTTFGTVDAWGPFELPNGKKISARRFNEEDQRDFGWSTPTAEAEDVDDEDADDEAETEPEETEEETPTVEV